MRNFACFLGVAAALSACGGGGGGSSDGGGSSPPASTPVAISAANYPVVAQEGLSASMSATDSAGLITGAQVSTDMVALRFARAQLPKLSGWLASAPKLVTGATRTETMMCDNGGNATVTVNDVNNNNAADVGDSFVMVANGCGFGGAVMTGTVSFAITALTGNLDTDVYNASISITLTNVSMASATTNSTANATMTATVISTAANAGSFSLSTANFTESGTRANVAFSRTLSNFNATLTMTPTGGASFSTSLAANGTVTSSLLENRSFTFTTVTPFVTVATQTVPSSGQATVTGANGSKARITVQSAGSVLLELDADGNGTYEASTVRTWSSLT